MARPLPALRIITFISSQLAFTGFVQLLLLATPVQTPTPTSIAKPTPTSTAALASTGGLDSTMAAALIGGGIAFLVALIGFLSVGYQVRRTHELEKLRQEEQRKYEAETLRLQRELEEKSRTKEQDEKRKEAEEEQKRLLKLREEGMDRRVFHYRKALQSDPEISHIQILNRMEKPLDVTSIYIRVRLHEEVRSGYKVDAELLAAERERNPNSLLQMSHRYLENRVSSAMEPEEALRRFRHCVIVGDPGAGKTTLLKYLTLQSVRGQLSGLPDMPIHINLSALVATGAQDLLDVAVIQWEKRYSFLAAAARSYMEEQLQRGEVIVLLDALDETVVGRSNEEAEASYARVRELILQLKARYSSAPIVVTARKAGYYGRAALTGFTELEVLDFRREDVELFIRRWFDNYPDAKKYGSAADLVERLKRAPRIQALAANPLLLSLIVLVYQDELDLPDQRAKLYEECVRTLLNAWDVTRGIQRRRAFKSNNKEQLLTELAWHFHKQGLRYFPSQELHEVVARFLPTINLPADQDDEIVKEIAAEHGLLKEQAQGWYGFLHLTLQEYFVAKYIVEPQERMHLLEQRGDPWWEEVFLLYAGQIKDASPLLSHLLDLDPQSGLKEDLFYTNTLLAGRCLAVRPKINQVALKKEIISRLWHTFYTVPYSSTRIQAIQVLLSLRESEIQNVVVRKLRDRQIESDVRVSIAGALGTLGERSAVGALMEMLRDEQIDESVRESIASAIGFLGERSVVGELIEMLRDEQIDEKVRESIASAIGFLGERSVVGELIEMLRDEQIKRPVRRSIAGAIGILGDWSVVGELMAMLWDKQIERLVRGSIAEAIGTLGERSVAGEMVQMLRDPRMEVVVRSGIASALGKLGEQSVAGEMVQMLRDLQIEELVRRSIASALGTLGERGVSGELMHMLRDERTDLFMRRSIASALGILGEQGVSGELMHMLRDSQTDYFIRAHIAGAIGALGERSLVGELVHMLRDPRIEGVLLRNVGRAIDVLGEKSVVGELMEMLRDSQIKRVVRASIANSLRKSVDSEGVLQAMADLLFSSDIADSIYEALGEISLRLRVRLFVVEDGQGGKRIVMEKWSQGGR